MDNDRYHSSRSERFMFTERKSGKGDPVHVLLSNSFSIYSDFKSVVWSRSVGASACLTVGRSVGRSDGLVLNSSAVIKGLFTLEGKNHDLQ